MTGLVSTTFAMEEEDDGPGPPVRTWVMDVDVDVAGGGWDESCLGCGGCPGGAAATPAAPRPRLDPAEPEPEPDPEEEEEGFPLEEEEEEDALLDFPGIAEGKSAKSSSSPGKEEEVRESGENRRGGATRPPGVTWVTGWPPGGFRGHSGSR